MFFYELHEGDEEMEPEDFFELVQAIRHNLRDRFEQDTLIEAIALELEREHDFTFVSDARLTASVHVSPDEKENRLVSLDDEMLESAEYRSILADLEGDPSLN